LFPPRRKIGRRFEHIYLAYRLFNFVGNHAYSSPKEYRKQRHAYWTTVWLVYLGITKVHRLHSNATVDSIRQAFDRFDGPGRAGQRARRSARNTRAAVWTAWRQARRADPELWSSVNFFKSKWGHKKVLQLAFPRVKKQLMAVGRELSV